MIKYVVISNARNFARGKKKINMKKIIAIFSVMLMFGLGFLQKSYAVDACQPQSCTGGNEMISVFIGGSNSSGQCFGCNEGDDAHECDGDAVIGRKDADGYIKGVYVCDTNWGNSWELIETNGWCSITDIKPSSNYDLPYDSTNYICFYSLNGTTQNYSGEVASLPSGGSPCKICKCNSGFRPNAARTDCELDTSAQERCENDPSHGQWNGSKCLCGADKTNRDENQTYKVQDQECKCSEPNIWNGSECANPDQSLIDACRESSPRANWVGGDVKCDCSGDEPEKKQSPDRMTCVDNTKYINCRDSHGDWNGGANGTCICDETNKGLVLRGEVCVCKDVDAIWNGRDKCETSPFALCEGTGGAFIPSQSDPNNGTCDCEADPDKHLTKKTGVTPERCVCKNDDYDWKTGEPNRDGCVLNGAAINRINTYNDLKRECEKWQGSWYPGNYEDDRNPNNWECTCPTAIAGVKQSGKVNCQCAIDEGYMREVANSKYICEQSTCGELKTLCEIATDENNNSGVAERWPRDAVNDEDACYCKCKDSNKFYDKGQNKCIVAENPMVEICRLYGAIVGKNDNCVCEESGLPPEKGKICSPSTSNGNASSGTVATVTDTRDKEKNIETLYVQLTSISDGFKKSHWKTASGNFNGARLASDSIAGVVLGTVGGVVTSNVIKKNQVKGGFESLQCTVGGQFVADFADQFQVGIR